MVSNEIEARVLRATIAHDVFNSHCVGIGPDRCLRPSDHRPVYADFDLGAPENLRMLRRATSAGTMGGRGT